jgi:hypothetical protein
MLSRTELVLVEVELICMLSNGYSIGSKTTYSCGSKGQT